MTAALEVVTEGVAVAIEDGGRPDRRRFGVPTSGALDPWLLAAANTLLGNTLMAAALEIPSLGPTLVVSGTTVAVALAGDIAAEIVRQDGERAPLPAWRAATMAPGDQLRVAAPRQGIAYLAVSGGIQTAPTLGSRSVTPAAGLGRALAVGDRLQCGPAAALRAAAPWRHESGPIRLLPGPQDDHFETDALLQVTSTAYRVLPASDRMGLRLGGPILRHNSRGAEIATDGVTPGALQVPADGQPILLLADAQTTGGYAKIGCVIRADLPRLAHCRPGATLTFQWVTRPVALDALKALAARFESWRAAPPPGFIDAAALYQHNLISGVTSGEEP